MHKILIETDNYSMTINCINFWIWLNQMWYRMVLYAYSKYITDIYTHPKCHSQQRFIYINNLLEAPTSSLSKVTSKCKLEINYTTPDSEGFVVVFCRRKSLLWDIFPLFSYGEIGSAGGSLIINLPACALRHRWVDIVRLLTDLWELTE